MISKQRQMSKDCLPGILVIVLEHPQGDAVIDTYDAELLLLGEEELNSINENVFKYSCFLQKDQENNALTVCNRSISAVLLFHISGVSAFYTGILHPDPIHTFSPKLLPSITFMRLKQWPPICDRLEVEGVKYEGNELVITEPEQSTFEIRHRFQFNSQRR